MQSAGIVRYLVNDLRLVATPSEVARARAGTTGGRRPIRHAVDVTVRTGDAYDLFLSHASEDKAAVVIPLAEELASRGIRVWLDEQQLTIGDSLSQKIDAGLSQSRFGAVVLSPSFFAKEWPKRELDGLVARETALGVKVILPIWHKVSRDEILEFSPTLAGKLAARTADGIRAVADQIAEVLSGPVDAGQVVTGGPDGPARPRSDGTQVPTARVAETDQSESLGAMVRSAVLSGHLPEVRAKVAEHVSGAEQALTTGAPAGFGEAMESLAALGGALALLAPEDPVTPLAITGPHRIFDAAQHTTSAWQVTEPIAASWPAMLTTIRALGALLTRLELWSAVRTLASHPPPPGTERVYPGWLTWMEAQIAQRRQTPPNAEHYRHPLREAAELIGRVEELRPDGPNENATLNSVIAFDFLSRLVEADTALRAGRPTEAYPNFAHFDARAVRPFTRRLATGGDIADQLLPGSDSDRVLALLGVVEVQAKAATSQHSFWDGIADQDLRTPIATAYARAGLAKSAS
jgi:hypothetical protein